MLTPLLQGGVAFTLSFFRWKGQPDAATQVVKLWADAISYRFCQVKVDLRCLDVGVTEQLLYLIERHIVLKKHRRKAMTQGMRNHVIRKPRFSA